MPREIFWEDTDPIPREPFWGATEQLHRAEFRGCTDHIPCVNLGGHTEHVKDAPSSAGVLAISVPPPTLPPLLPSLCNHIVWGPVPRPQLYLTHLPPRFSLLRDPLLHHLFPEEPLAPHRFVLVELRTSERLDHLISRKTHLRSDVFGVQL